MNRLGFTRETFHGLEELQCLGVGFGPPIPGQTEVGCGHSADGTAQTSDGDPSRASMDADSPLWRVCTGSPTWPKLFSGMPDGAVQKRRE